MGGGGSSSSFLQPERNRPSAMVATIDVFMVRGVRVLVFMSLFKGHWNQPAMVLEARAVHESWSMTGQEPEAASAVTSTNEQGMRVDAATEASTVSLFSFLLSKAKESRPSSALANTWLTPGTAFTADRNSALSALSNGPAVASTAICWWPRWRGPLVTAAMCHTSTPPRAMRVISVPRTIFLIMARWFSWCTGHTGQVPGSDRQGDLMRQPRFKERRSRRGSVSLSTTALRQTKDLRSLCYSLGSSTRSRTWITPLLCITS